VTVRARIASAVALILLSCAGASPETRGTTAPALSAIHASTPEPAPLDSLAPGFRITNYTLAQESELSGKRSGNHSRVTARGLPGEYAWEFLCSNRGVAMQGTGVTEDGKLVHYVSGGNGFCGRDRHLCDCKNARFAPATRVVGASGRDLVENFSIAVDPNVIAYGSYVWIDAMKRWYRADDTGGAIVGNHIDVYVGTQPFVFNGETSVFVTSTPRAPTDAGPSGADVACARDALVCGDAIGTSNRMLFQCHDGRASFARSCPSGCRRGNGNADDACMPRAPTPYCSNDGWYCGGDRVDGIDGALYRCTDHALVLEAICAEGCAIDPDGIADGCY
jgi:3D (Asp-Asp-Asp) domain-containing protein